MAAYPIGWHQECAKNQRHSLAADERELQRVQDRVRKHAADLAFYESQIAEAIRCGKTEVDRDKFLKKRNQGPA